MQSSRNIRLICILGMVSSAAAQVPSEDGQWTDPFDLPLIAIHAAALPTGKLLLFSAEHGVPGIHGWILDPASIPGTPALTNVPPPAPWNPDCAGHSFLPDGRLLVAGGTLQFNPILGSKLAFLFDPFVEQWIQVEDMRSGRWYPTNITVPDGSIITVSGLDDSSGNLNPDVERWDPKGSANWELLGQRTTPFYPYLHVLQSGLIFRSGPDQNTETLDPATGNWAFVGPRVLPDRYEAPSVLLPPTLDRVMIIGGYSGSGGPTNSAEIIDFGAPSPTWTSTAHMSFARMECNAVLLPDETVLVVGGKSSPEGSPDVPVNTPEVFDPSTATWDQVAPHQVPRMYHSTAILLPDARVFLGGADFQPSGEIYSPAYLFRGPRPVIQAAPAVLPYGKDFNLSFSSSHNLNTVVLIRLSSVTHSVNMGQRYVALAQVSTNGGTITVPAPSNASLAPPGFYMLFVVDNDGVPSASRIVRMVTGFSEADVDEDGDVDGIDFSVFSSCFNKAGNPPRTFGCDTNDQEALDFDDDNDVDGVDFSVFASCYNGAGNPPRTNGCPPF